MDPVAALYPFGTVVRLTALPQPGNYFAAWGDAASSTNNSLLFEVTNANPTVSCLFAPLSAGQFALTIFASGRGSVRSNPRGSRFTSGQSVTLTAWPEADQSFLGWSGDANGTQTNLVVVMNQSKIINANFSRHPRLSLGPCFGRARADGFQFTLTGEIGARYEISGSTDLLQWTPVASITNWFGTVQLLEVASTNQLHRFYRARLAP